MKKKKLKLSLNKSIVAKLQENNMEKILGGDVTRTWDNTCLDKSQYPACRYTGNYPTGPCDTGTWQ